MTAQNIKKIILSFTNDVILNYRNDDIFINPWNERKFELEYKNVVKTYEDIDSLMSDPIYNGKSLNEIAAEITN